MLITGVCVVFIFFQCCSCGTVIHLEKSCSESWDSHSQQIQECESQTHEHESRTLADKSHVDISWLKFNKIHCGCLYHMVQYSNEVKHEKNLVHVL